MGFIDRLKGLPALYCVIMHKLYKIDIKNYVLNNIKIIRDFSLSLG